MSTDSKNLTYVVLGRMITAALHSVFYILFAYLLEPTEYGQLSYFIAIAGTVSIFSRFGFPFTVSINLAKGNTDFSNQANLFVIITTATAALFLINVNIYVALLSFGMSLFIMNEYNLTGLKKYKTQMGVNITKGVLIICIPIILFFIMEIPGILLGMFISNILCSIHFLKNLKLKFGSFSEFSKNGKIMINNFGVDVSTNIPRIIDKLLIVPIFGFLFAGIYQFNLQILFGFEMLPLAVHAFLLSEESSGKKHQKINYVIILLSIVIVIGVVVFFPIIMNELFPKYSEGIPSLQIMIFSIIPLSLAYLINAKLQAKGSTKIGYSAVIRIGSLLILIAIFGNLFGLVGLAVAVLLSSIFYTLFLSILYIKSK